MEIKRPLSPLAERMRPGTLNEFHGQEHLTGEGRLIRRITESGNVFSIILWGGPGTGKTTLASLIASSCGMESFFLSAISAGVPEVRKVIEKGREARLYGKNTLLFLDEIHRFNKAQQDAVLGAVESGDIVLIGATTENPSFSVIAPLLSRTRVVRLEKLSDENIVRIIDAALQKDELLKNYSITFADGVKERIAALGAGDARRALNLFETAFILSGKGHIGENEINEALASSVLYYDKKGDRHYDTISAFIKSLRGSDPDAAVYYLSRMILAGEDPMFIARRMVILASEDIGNASPSALNLAVSAMTAVKEIGLPEAEIILSQCAVFLASSPKSNASYMAINRAKASASADHSIPMHLRNAPTKLMKESGYGRSYKYPHDYEGAFVKETYLPDEVKNERYYTPSEEGTEKSIRERLKKLWPDRY